MNKTINSTKKLDDIKNKVIVVGVYIKDTINTKENSLEDFLYNLEELKNLCESCNMEVLDQIYQNSAEINKRTYVGKGKIEEIRMMIDSLGADTLVCNDELSPSQIENLENILDVSVIDRTFVILEIFKRRAKTKEALLQVEIASLKYYLPRLKGLRSGMSRQGGGRNKGKGETQLELDKRQIEKKIYILEQELKELTKNRQNQRERRKKNEMFIVSLVGYTNSGKSTTLNAILEHYSHNSLKNDDEEKKYVLEKDLLFATLETSTRLIKLKNNIEFLLTDTVGFVNKLPHTLVETFKSTLEEIKESSLIIHVVDSSNDHFLNQIKVTNKVLSEIGASSIPTIYAFNKIDKTREYFYIPNEFENALRYSAKSGLNLDYLIEQIENNIYSKYHTCTLHIPYDKQELVALINKSSKVINIKYEDSIIINAMISNYLFNYLNKYIVK